MVIDSLKSIFSRFGVPETVISDNGPQFASQLFADFADTYSFQHVTSSPLFAQSNGQAERTVQTVKKLLRESKDPHMSMMTYRSTPFPWCKLSPAELLMGRRLRGNMPLLTAQLIPNWSFMEEFRSQNNSFKEQQKQEYDQRHGVRSLSPIPDNSDVWITSGEQPATGTVIRPAYTPRSYIVDTPSGQVRRNRQHLNIVPACHEPTDSTDSQTTDSTDSPTRDQIITRSRSGTAVRPPDRL